MEKVPVPACCGSLTATRCVAGVCGAERAGDRQEPGAAVEGDGSMDQV